MLVENNQVENKSLNYEQKVSIKIEKDVSISSLAFWIQNTFTHILNPTMLPAVLLGTWKFKQKNTKTFLSKKFRLKVIFWWNDRSFYWRITFKNILYI